MLAAAPDDAARLALLQSSTPAIRAAMAEDLWWLRASFGDVQRRYLELLGLDPNRALI